MLKSVNFKNFRCFEDYTLDNLTRVNLLVGGNNSGKTTVLDGIKLINSEPMEMFTDFAARRDLIVQDKNFVRNYLTPIMINRARNGQNIYDNNYVRLFINLNDILYKKATERKISIKIDDYDDKIKTNLDISIKPSNQNLEKVDINTLESINRLIPNTLVLNKSPNYLILELNSSFLTDQSREHYKQQPPIYKFFYPIFKINSIDTLIDEQLFAHGESATSGGTNSIKYLVTKTLFQDMKRFEKESLLTIFRGNIQGRINEQTEIINSLQKIDKSIVSVTASEYQFLINVEKQNEPLYLGYFGDGVGQILMLAILLATVKDGILLIDEIDTGLHYSVQQKMWEMVIKTAQQLNVQVFATTHSQDCIKALASLCENQPELKEEVSLHRIDKEQKTSIDFTADEIRIAVNGEIEVR